MKNRQKLFLLAAALLLLAGGGRFLCSRGFFQAFPKRLETACCGSSKPQTGRLASSRTRLTAWLSAPLSDLFVPHHKKIFCFL